MSQRLITYQQLASEKNIHLSRCHLRRLIRAGQFPKPVRLSANRIAFLEHEIDAHIADRIVARDAITREAA